MHLIALPTIANSPFVRSAATLALALLSMSADLWQAISVDLCTSRRPGISVFGLLLEEDIIDEVLLCKTIYIPQENIEDFAANSQTAQLFGDGIFDDSLDPSYDKQSTLVFVEPEE